MPIWLAAILVFVIVSLVVLLAGMVVKAAGGAVPAIAAIGDFLVKFCWIIGLIAAVIYLFTGSFGPLKL